ncbi:sulfotransferase domain-containing protein [Pleurocapsales cyanobacterium LEGE 10410]|nr:sulfotransferase domain-containing protein [Pleurocapsales cyanobacterium LEGE 10410]
MKPNFLVLGAAKSGTTWLYSCLEEHPEIFVPSIKEIHFFSYPSNYEKGFAWYESFFKRHTAEKSIGEVSPSYLVRPEVPERIYNYNPNMRLLVVLRNPIARAYSNYCMILRVGKISKDINRVFSVEDEIHPLISRGLYYGHITRYLDFFKLENMKILIFEDIKHNPERFINDVYSFLNVDSDFKPSILYSRQNPKQSLPKFKKVYYSLVSAKDWIRKNSRLGVEVIDYLRRYGYFDMLHQINRGEEFPVLSQEVERNLADFFQADVSSLSKLIDRDLSFWLEPYYK